jgi:YggT family protein
MGALVGLVLLVFELLMVARVVLGWVGMLAPAGSARLVGVNRAVFGLTEPVIAPVRQVLKPVRIGPVALDLAFTAVFVAVVLLRGLLAAG